MGTVRYNNIDIELCRDYLEDEDINTPGYEINNLQSPHECLCCREYPNLDPNTNYQDPGFDTPLYPDPSDPSDPEPDFLNPDPSGPVDFGSGIPIFLRAEFFEPEARLRLSES